MVCFTLRYFIIGEVAEWTIALVLKTRALVTGAGGSNPSLSAKNKIHTVVAQPG